MLFPDKQRICPKAHPIFGRKAPGSLLIHDLERALGVLSREGGGFEGEAHRANVNDSVYL